MNTRARKQAKAKKPADSLINALKFLLPAQKKTGPFYFNHCMLKNGWAVASSPLMTIGTRINETDINAYPHTYTLIDALSKTGEELSIIQLSSETLSIKSGPFNALVPCQEIDVNSPDENMAELNNEVKDALLRCSNSVLDKHNVANFCCVLLQESTAVGCNGVSLIEVFHGVDLPPNMLIPKAAAVAIGKCKKALTGFGYSGTTATFYFEDESFIQTALELGNYHNYKTKFENNLKTQEIETELFKAVSKLATFSETGFIYFKNGEVLSSHCEESASVYKLENFEEDMAFDIKLFLKLKDEIKKAFFNKNANILYFFGENSRGVLMGVQLTSKANLHNSAEEDIDDLIPF